MSNTSEMGNCGYRYDVDNPTVTLASLIIDGPLTLLAGLLAIISGHFAIRFLNSAGLNRDLTAALYTLAICDVFLMIAAICHHAIEATGILLFNTNIMWNHQDTTLLAYFALTAATTASTLLVVIITFQRFFVVWWPLKYARPSEQNKKTQVSFRFSNSYEGPSQTQSSMRKMLLPANVFQRKKYRLRSKKALRSYAIPFFVIVFSITLYSTSLFEFKTAPCWSELHGTTSNELVPSDLRLNKIYYYFRTAIFMATQTFGPILSISFITAITEYKVYTSMQARRKLFESQRRRRSVVVFEELREKVARAVAIFIAVKFIILRSMPVFFDIYESINGIESFGTIITILVRLSDFGILLNSATNSLAYFGRRQWLENRFKDRILRKHHSTASDRQTQSQKSLSKKHSSVKKLANNVAETENSV